MGRQLVNPPAEPEDYLFIYTVSVDFNASFF